MDREINSVGELRRELRSKKIKYVFVRVGYSEDDSIYVGATKASIRRAFEFHPPGSAVNAIVRSSELDALFIG